MRAEDRMLLKLAVCGLIFVLAVAIKLLFPETAGSFIRSASQLIGMDADFKEAFAAVGRATSGEETVEDSLHEAYAAVFHASSVSEAIEKQSAPCPEKQGEDSSRTSAVKIAVIQNKKEGQGEQAVVSDASDASETISNGSLYYLPSLPENASLEQRSLGFSYTTPVLGTMTSSFGWREHPVTGDTRFHYGLDLAAEKGTDICAFADGEVYAAGESSTLGKYIILSHAQGYKTLYGHCSSVVKLGGSVSMGEVIATVGDSGVTTGSHLHFEIQNGTTYFNPIYYVELG